MADVKFNDGGAAFPTSQDNTEYSERGISMRDYFAAAALSHISFNAAGKTNEEDAFRFYCDLARHAYGIADAMLAERDKR